MKYKIKKDCYYGEAGMKQRLYKAGDVYESSTLKPEKAPSYFELIGNVPVAAPKGQFLKSASVGMSYNEMKKFVKDNEIEVPDIKQKTLEAAIIAFQNKVADNKQIAADGEAEAKKAASDLKTSEAKKEDIEIPMTQGGEND